MMGQAAKKGQEGTLMKAECPNKEPHV